MRWLCITLLLVIYQSSLGEDPANYSNKVQFCNRGLMKAVNGSITSDYDLKVGETLKLNCTVHGQVLKEGNLTYELHPKNLYFRFRNNDIVNHLRLVNKSLLYEKPNSTVNDTGTYMCNIRVNEHNSRILHVCLVMVNVGYEPLEPEDFNCIVTQLSNITCSWKIPNNGIRTSYTVKDNIDIIKGFNRERNCPIYNEKRTSCSWTKSSEPAFRSETDVFYINVYGNNTLRKRKFSYSFPMSEIIKVSKPTNLVCVAQTSRSLTVSWNYPKEIEERRKLNITYEIRYRSEYAAKDKWEVVKIHKKYMHNDPKEELMIVGLNPYTHYTIEIRACSTEAQNKSYLWSDFAVLNEKTLKAMPDYSPKVSPNGYIAENFQSQRNIRISFMEIPQSDWNDHYMEYVVQGCEDTPDHEENCKTITSEAPTANFNHLQRKTAYHFRIFSKNSEGMSRNFSYIFVDKTDNLLHQPRQVIVFPKKNGQHEISWEPPENGDDFNYTVFWCPAVNSNLYLCNKSVHWKNTASTNYTINLTSTDNLIYAVAANRHGQTSGIEWAKCVVSSTKELSKISVVTLEKNGPSSLLMRWQLACSVLKSRVEYYQIELCPLNLQSKTVALNAEECKDSKYDTSSCQLINVTNGQAEEVVLDKLNPSTPYRALISAWANGMYTQNSPVACAFTSSVGPRIAMIVGIAVGAALGLCILVFVLYLLASWMKKKVDTIKKIKIQLPEGLDSSEDSRMHNYENFKNGLVRKASNPNLTPQTMYGRMGSFAMDNNAFKNRHGSGNSQGSSSSTDELLYKKSKRSDTFGRNPSGDSSGCSTGGHDSLSSVVTNRTYMSGDSGAESDPAAPPSPDSLFGDGHHTPLARCRPHLPKVDEDQDHESKDSGLDREEKSDNESSGVSRDAACSRVSNSSSVQSDKAKALPQLSYSKFGLGSECSAGYSGSSGSLGNQLLANSEPSFLDVDVDSPDMSSTLPGTAPYSKFGLAKSATDLNSSESGAGTGPYSVFSPSNSSSQQPTGPPPMPYSRFGLRNPHHRPSSGKPYGGTDFTVGMMLEQPRVLPHIKEIALRSTPKPPSGYVSVGQAMSTPLPSSENNNGQGYSRFSIQQPPSVAPSDESKSSGYVPLQSMLDTAASATTNTAVPPSSSNESSPSTGYSKFNIKLSDGDLSPSSDDVPIVGDNSNLSLEDFSFSSLSGPTSNEEGLNGQEASSAETSLKESPVKPLMNGYVPHETVAKDAPPKNGYSRGYVSHNAALGWSPPDHNSVSPKHELIQKDCSVQDDSASAIHLPTPVGTETANHVRSKPTTNGYVPLTSSGSGNSVHMGTVHSGDVLFVPGLEPSEVDCSV